MRKVGARMHLTGLTLHLTASNMGTWLHLTVLSVTGLLGARSGGNVLGVDMGLSKGRSGMSKKDERIRFLEQSVARFLVDEAARLIIDNHRPREEALIWFEARMGEFGIPMHHGSSAGTDSLTTRT